MFDTDEAAPNLPPEVYDRLKQTLSASGPHEAIEQLCQELKAIGDLDSLFYTLLMKKRVELGISPFPTGSSAELPPETHESYENAIRDAGRLVGSEFLKKNDVRKAWFYFNMLGEPEVVRDYLDRHVPGADDDIQPLIEVALYHGVHPNKGFDLVVERYGICNAITTFSGQDFSKNPEAKQHAIRALIRHLYEQLLDRLKVDLENRGKKAPEGATVGQILRDYPEVMEEGAYHIDTSHLSSVAQFSLEVEAGLERRMAREICEYGAKLSDGLQYPSDPPFEKTYADYLILLKLLDGEGEEAGLKHFFNKIEPGLAEGNTFPAEVYVNILLQRGRSEDALAIAKKYLTSEQRTLTCPSVYELCQRARDFTGLTAAAQSRGDSVNFLAGLIAGR